VKSVPVQIGICGWILITGQKFMKVPRSFPLPRHWLIDLASVLLISRKEWNPWPAVKSNTWGLPGLRARGAGC